MIKQTFSQVFNLFNNMTTGLLLAILIGSLVGFSNPELGDSAGSYIDPIILVLVFLLLFEVPVKGILKGLTQWRFLSLACWVVNFVVIPTIGFVVASLLLSGEALFFTGLIIYFMAPCTDWFLGFTRLAKGNIELGAALIPINMATQIILFPVYLWLFGIVVDYEINLSSMIEWFLQPLLAAIFLRIVLHRFMDKALPVTQLAIPLALSLLVGLIFSANINQLLEHVSVVPLLLSAIFAFFLLTYFVGEGVAKVAKLDYPEHTLLTFTTSARNAPLMLGLTTIALPDQPLVYATITIGMLIEFPHLTALRHLMLRRRKNGTHNLESYQSIEKQTP